MKRTLLSCMFCLTALLGLHAQSDNDAIYIYRNDGQFNAFFDAQVDSITCSHYDADSIWHSDWQMQVVHTSDSIYRIPLAVIDSVTFHPLEPVLNEKVFPLTPEHAPYILSADTLSFTMSSTTPNPLRPSLGNIVVASYDCMAFPDGIMALVVSVEETSSGILYLCESASMDDVYEQILYHGICENPGAATRFTGRADGILWDEDFQMQIAAGGTTTDFSVNDVAAFEITLQKTLGSPLYTRIVVANNIRMQVDFNASSEASISEQRQLGPTVNCGRIGVPQFPLIWFAPQLMLYGYFEEDGAVSLDFSAHMNRRDKITLTYNGGQWTSRHDPFVESAVDVASLSMDGSAEIGLKPEIRLSLNGSPTSIGISLRSGVKQYCSFKFDALSYLDTGVYDALKESRFRTALTRGGSIFAQAGIIESSSMRHEHPLLDSEQPLGEERWLLPLFTAPEYSEGASKNMAILSSTVSRELLFPVEVGLSLYDDKDNLVSTKYHPVSYGSSDTWNFTQLEQSFESLSPGKRYVCYPTVKLFGAEYRATPSRDFRLDALVETGEASSVTASSAVVSGYAEGLESAETLCELGICYSTSGTPSMDNGKFVSSGRKLSGDFTVSVSDLKPNTTYYYTTCLAIDGEYFYGETKSFKTKGADLCNDANHVHAVDLGLSVKWACCNVGASVPEGYGGYYAWGETEEKSSYTEDTYKYCNDRDGNGWCSEDEYQNIGSNISGTSYDVAHVKWGGGWRMPTEDEIQELINKCSWKWTTVNGIRGYKVTGPNGSSIFLPAAGDRYGTGVSYRGSYGSYWSGTLSEGYSNNAYCLHFFSSGGGSWGGNYRSNGRTVRPVTDK
ncbi:MAG: hypothetical protein IKK87_00565 [Bacteroidaceae bacterium]|nr:hypothetical protein [Bacteroidaceae bacterium]